MNTLKFTYKRIQYGLIDIIILQARRNTRGSKTGVLWRPLTMDCAQKINNSLKESLDCSKKKLYCMRQYDIVLNCIVVVVVGDCGDDLLYKRG